ncbi:MAG: 4Fe-4S binding protein [Deltaproteobacteria bacterium]|nr:4Fe-4S binding protein [Deltaproteobacteria bacterium]
MDNIEPIYKELAAKITKEKNKTLPKVLKKAVNLDQAEILNALPDTIEGVANKLSLDEETVRREMQILFEKGVAMRGRKRWNLVNHIILVKDLMASAGAKHIDDELLEMLHTMSLEGTVDLEKRVKNGEKVPPVVEVMRVWPKWRTVKDIPGLLPIEDVREILKQPPIVVHNCPCRMVYKDRPCKDDVPVNVCIAVGPNGKAFLDRGAGKEITYDEAIAFLDDLDEFPVVHTTGNSDVMSTILCSCCSDCCGLFVRAASTKPVLGKVPYAKSRFVVVDNPEECTDCGLCLDNRCPVNAISMKEIPGLDGERSYTNVEECIGCGLCVLSCPTDARTMKLVRPPEHIPSPASVFDRSDKD